MKSIQTKFITLILVCVLLSSTVIGGAGILYANRVVDADSAQIMNQLCSERAGELDSLLSRIEQSVETLSAYTLEQLESVERLRSDNDYRDGYTEHLEAIAVNMANNTEGAIAVYIRFNPEFTSPDSGLFWKKNSRKGSFRRLPPTDLSKYDSMDQEHVGWYYIPLQYGNPIWIAPYFNDNIKTQIISYVIPIYKDKETVGVVGMDIDFGMIENLTGGVRIYENGYAFLTDVSGIVLYHKKIPAGTQLGSYEKSLIPLVDELQSDSSGSELFYYMEGGEEKCLAFRTLINDMKLAVTAPASEIHASRNKLIAHMLTALFAVSGVSVLLTVWTTRKMISPLKELNAAAKKIADGDMSVSITCHTKDEVGMLAESFRQTMNHLQKYINYINGLAYRDSLTGVKNKTAYLETERRIEEQMRLGRPEFAVIVLDINNLKTVNDTCGHDFGDMLIIDACRLICNTFRHSPVYRIGGDEFVVILENSELERHQQLLEELELQTEEYNNAPDRKNCLSVARGIAIYDSNTDLVFANVFKRADEAMYRNKAAVKAQNGQGR